MGKTITNLSIVLGFITVAFAGYYLFVQQAEGPLQFNNNEQTMQNMLVNTRVFIERRQALNEVALDRNMSVFEDDFFRSLRSFSTPIQERPVGRANPFDVAVTPTASEESTE